MELLSVVLSTFLSIAVIFIITKLMGHKQVAQLDFFDYVSGITIGSIAAELATDIEAPWKPLVATVVYGIVSMILNYITRRIMRSRRYVNGAPIVLMEGGRIYRESMKKAKLDLTEFMLLCRERGYFDLDDIGIALFECNGKLSVLPRAESRPVTARDLEIGVKTDSRGYEIIMDGVTLFENLVRIGRDERWLSGRLSELGYADVGGVLLAIYYPADGRLSVYPM